jgi:hypothetical protein
MNTETKSITEANVVSFLQNAAALLSTKTAESYAIVRVSYNNHGGELEWGAYVDGGTHTTGKTLNEAIEAELKEMGPLARARRMRAEAEAIIKRAEQLEQGAS